MLSIELLLIFDDDVVSAPELCEWLCEPNDDESRTKFGGDCEEKSITVSSVNGKDLVR